ncbi:MAG: hypothetical protein FWC43_09090 [Planctomycetaceae bacterium]|nr:hypothetical protein [Planctomycetaceae bacterium]
MIPSRNFRFFFLLLIVCFCRPFPQTEASDATVAETVQKCGGLIVRDAQTGKVTEVDVAANRSSVDDEAFSAIVQLTGLKKLSLSGASLSEQSLKKLESLTSLEELYLVDTITTDDDLDALSRKLKNLRRLTLRRLTKLSDQGLSSLGNLKELRNLALLNLSLGGPGLESVSSLSSLRALDLRGCNQLTSEDYQHLTKMTALTDLKIGGASVNADVLRAVAALPNLTALTVEDATVPTEVWEELFANPQWSENMTSLAFARMYTINDRVLEKLSNFKKLKSLSLRALPVRGSFVSNLAPDSPLFTNLQTLGMTKNYASADEILQLKRFKNLKKLDFSATPMTLEKIEALCTLDQIETLMLVDCQLSDEMLEKLMVLKNSIER